MHGLARICVQRPVFATVLSLTLLVVGVLGYLGLGVDRFPDIEFPVVMVTTIYPGAAPEEVESEITDKIERQVNTIGGIEALTSTSGDGISLVRIQFDLKKDADVAAEEVRSKVALAKADLPPDAEEPVVLKFDVGAVPVISYVVSSDQPLRDIYELVDKKIRRRVESVSGVGEVQVIGGRERQINVVLDPYRMRAYGVTAKDISDALKDENAQIPGGLVEQGDRQLTLRTRGRLPTVAEFERIPVKSFGDRQILIRDVARVEDGEARPTSLAAVGGQEAVVLQIVKQSDANAVAVIESIKDRMDEVIEGLPPGYRVQVVRDQSTYIEASLGAVREHLMLGALLAALVVLMFLRSGRSTIIAALAIPTSIITTFALMKYLGFTQNVVTLLALTLSVGIVIDDAIVVLENVFRVIEEEGLGPFDAAIQATREIGLAVLAITLSLLAVFLPIAFMGGIVGRFLNSFGITMACAIAVSMFISFSLTPMLCSRWLTREQAAQQEEQAASKRGWFGAFDAAYTRLLEWSLRHRWAVALVAAAVMGSALILPKFARKNFLPVDDEAQFQVLIRAPEGTSLEGTRRVLDEIAAEIDRLPEVKLTLVTIGDDYERTPNLGTIFVRMEEVEDRQDRSVTQFGNMAYVREKILPRFAGRGLTMSVQMTSSFGGGSNADIQIAVSGPSLSRLADYSRRAVEQCAKIPGVADADSSLVAGKPELQAIIDRDRAAALGASVIDIAKALRLAVGGDEKITSFEENGEQYEVHIRLDERYRRDQDGIALLQVPSQVGGRKGSVGLEQIARFEQTAGFATTQRYNRQRQFLLLINLLPSASQGEVTKQVESILTGLNMGPGYSVEYTGKSREFAKTFRNFGIAFLLSFIFMYLVIAAQFESFVHALAIMMTLPLTVPFGILSIIVTGDSLNIFSMLGMLVLLGVVKKNAILQIDRANQLRAQGMSLHDAVVQAARDRLRPILMTTLAFVAGMLPLVLSRGTGAATNHSTGGVIVGGQLLSLLLTLIAAPVLYVMLDGVADSPLCRLVRRTVFRQRDDDLGERPARDFDSGVRTGTTGGDGS